MERHIIEEEIDLRRYVEALVHQWRLVVILPLVAAVVAFAVSSVMTPTYEATARVVMLRSRAELSLGSQFESLTEENVALGEAMQGQFNLERTKRRLTSLADMVTNGTIAEQVSDELSELWAKDENEDEGEPSWLIDRVEGQVLEESDTIKIVVTHSDPEKAAAIANAWAQAFEKRVNAIYSEAPYTPFADIHQQVEDARAEYEQAQGALVTFLAEENRIGELERQIAEEEAAIAKLREGRQVDFAAVVDSQVAVQKRLFQNTVAAEVSDNLKVFERQRDELKHDFERASNRKRRLEDLLEEALVIQRQLDRGGEDSAATTGLSLLAFKSKVLGASEGLPFGTLDLQMPSVDGLSPSTSAQSQAADLNGLIETLRKEIEDLDAELQAQAQALAQGESYQFLETLSPESLDVGQKPSAQALARMQEWGGLLPYGTMLDTGLAGEIDRLENGVRQRKAEIARLSGRKTDLQQDRDLAWQAYNNLLSKEQELEIASAAEGSEVRFASPALPPRNPVSPKKLMNAAMGLALGGMLGVFGAFALEWWQGDEEGEETGGGAARDVQVEMG